MRNIVFRGRKTHSHEWAEGSLITADNFTAILEAEDEVHPMDYPYLNGDLGTIDGKATPVEPETIGQFTGLIDKNGRKVFERDMVVSYDLFGSVDACGVVNWNDLFCARHIGKNSMYGNRIATYEVIGNIHDSPEPHATKILTREE